MACTVNRAEVAARYVKIGWRGGVRLSGPRAGGMVWNLSKAIALSAMYDKGADGVTGTYVVID